MIVLEKKVFLCLLV